MADKRYAESLVVSAENVSRQGMRSCRRANTVGLHRWRSTATSKNRLPRQAGQRQRSSRVSARGRTVRSASVIKPTGSPAGTATRTVPTRCPHALRWCLRARRNATTGVSSVVMVSSSHHGEFNAQNTAHGAEHAGQWQVRGPRRVWSPHLWIPSWRPGLGGFLATANR